MHALCDELVFWLPLYFHAKLQRRLPRESLFLKLPPPKARLNLTWKRRWLLRGPSASFNVKENPYITFKSTKIEQMGPDTFDVAGDFTIRGVTRPEKLKLVVHHALASDEEFLRSVFEDLGIQRVEIDCLELSGPAFESWDRNKIHGFLVAGGYAEAVVFPADSHLLPPNAMLYKRALVLAPGRFDSMEQLHANLVRDTLTQLPEEELTESKGGLGLFCLSTVGANAKNKEVRHKDIVKTCGNVARGGLRRDPIPGSGTLQNERVRESIHEFADSLRDRT